MGTILYSATGRVADGLRFGLGACAPIKVTKNSLLSSDTYVYIKEDAGKILIGDYTMKNYTEYDGDPIVYIHNNSNCYRDYDGYDMKDFTDQVKIIVSNVKKVGEYNFYPVFACDIKIESVEDPEWI